MRVTNISELKSLITAACDVNGITVSNNTVTFTVDKTETSKDLIGQIGDSRFLLRGEGVDDIKAGSTIQVNVEDGTISAVVAPKKASTTKPATSTGEREKSGRSSPAMNPDVSMFA